MAAEFTDLMLDLETLGTEADSMVLSIGAVLFNKDTGKFAKEHFHAGLLVDFQGGSIKTSTIEWWLGMEQAARDAIRAQLKQAREPYLVLNAFKDWIIETLAAGGPRIGGEKQADYLEVWGNGASFDQPILRRLARDSNVELPWKFWNERCFRTLRSIAVPRTGAKKGKLELPADMVAALGPLTDHNAAHDALKQAAELCVIWPKFKVL